MFLMSESGGFVFLISEVPLYTLRVNTSLSLLIRWRSHPCQWCARRSRERCGPRAVVAVLELFCRNLSSKVGNVFQN